MLYQSPTAIPETFSKPSVFIAGGISNCPDWQADVVALMNTKSFDVINPRRTAGFDSTGKIAEEQITWEHDALSKTDKVVFWFPKETLCPITLFELGMALERFKNQDSLIIGWHPEYPRAFDLRIQIDLADAWTQGLRKGISGRKKNIIYANAGWENFLGKIKSHWG